MTHSMRLRSMRLCFALIIVAGIGFVPVVADTAWSEEAQTREVARLNPAPVAPRRLNAIDVEQLTLESDFSIFMKPDCPPALQKKALQRLWKLLPAPTVQVNSAI